MSGKNLTFKLVMDADTKGFVSNVKLSENTAKSVFNAIKQESEKLKQATNDASKEMGNIIPKGTSELADKLSQSLNAATGMIKDAGDNAKTTAGNFTDFGNKAEKALDQLKGDLAQAKQNLEAFSKTKASPVDIEKAQIEVDQLEKEVQQADQAFNGFQAEVNKANTSLKDTDNAAQTAQKGIDGAKFAVNALAGAMAALGIGLGIRELAEAADSYTNLSVRIQIATREGGNFQQAMAGVHQVALATNSSLQATGDLFTRLNAVGKEMGMTQQQALDLTKTVTQAIQIGGGSAQASEAAVTQFIQAMQGGVLRGEEFNSIMENGYGLAEALAKGLGVTTGELRKMAENGELSAERVVKAIGSQAKSVQETYDQFPLTIGNALQRISTSWEILIGKMDQSNGASATVADWLVTIADNLNIIEVLLNDMGDGVVWVGDQLNRIDPQTIEALKQALLSAYESLKELGSAVGDAFEITLDVLNGTLDAIFRFNNGVSETESKTNGLTKALQGVNVAIGFIGDGFNAIGIVANLLTGVFFDVSAAFYNLKAAFTWGDTKTQAIADMEAMAAKAQEYYNKASDGAVEFKSRGVEAIQAISQTQEENNAQSLADAKTTMDQLLAEQQREVEGKKATEEEKLKAVRAYAEAAVAANKGVIDGTMQADLMAKGYIVTVDQAGKVSVEAWSNAEEGAEGAANASDKARKAATALGLDLDVSLNRVSAKFKETETSVDNFSAGLEDLGVTGEDAANLTYEAWLKWLQTAKSQAEIDYAKAKLEEFGNQGQISTSQVEQGLIAIKIQAQGLPDDIDPVTEAFKRLGIQTKEQLKLAAQQALMDYITIRDSGKATAEDVQKAYEKAAQSAAASGDAGRIAAVNAMNAGRNLEVQIDDTGKAVVKTMDDWTKSNHRVRDSARGIGDGFRHAGQIAREEAKSSTEAWADAVNKAKSDFNKEMKRQGEALSKGIYEYDSYTKSDVISQLKSKGYDDKEAEKLASTIWSKAMAADRDAKAEGLGKESSVAMKALINAEFDRAAANGITTQHGTNKINELLRSINVASTGSGSLGDYAPSIPSSPSVSNSSQPSKEVTYNFDFNGKQMKFTGPAGQESLMNELVNQLKVQAKST